MSKENKPFFVGYLGIPAGLKGFLLKTSLIILAGFAVGGVLAGVSQDDPGKAGFRFDYGRQTITGVIEASPYPILHVTEGNERVPTGHSVMLTGQGKSGAMAIMASLEGTLVQATGIVLERGELDMLQLLSGQRGIQPMEEESDIPQVEELGTWRLQGEICDGKCLAGAMQPGRGLAHKACANLCLEGDIPPVFVSTQPVEGSEFLLVGDIEGGPLSRDAYDYVGQFVEIEAKVQRRGDLLVMLIDPEKLKVVE
ncbi:MAG: hypothetical protein AAGF54_13025 [Pseudomonadota bacterium]